MKSSRLAQVALLSALVLAGCNDSGLVGANHDLDAENSAATTAATSMARAAFPDVIPLPNGFQPEGLAIGPGTTFYVGSLLTGAILRGDLRSGELESLVAADGSAAGMEYDARSNLLWVANGGSGSATAYDAETGEIVQHYALGGGLINDPAITRDAVYFTDTFAPVLFVVPLGKGGAAPEPSSAFALPLSGDYEPATAPLPGFPAILDANGLVATPNGKWLVLVNSTTGLLYRVEPSSGHATLIEVDGAGPLVTADGLVLRGHRLYVLQNFLNQISVVELSPDLLSGEVIDVITNADLEDVQLDIPASAEFFGNALYVLNANFDDADPFVPDLDALPGIPFEVVRVVP